MYRFFQKMRFADFELDPTARPIDMFRYRDLADHFGDLVVLVDGFHCDFEPFAISLVQGWLDSQPHANVPTAAKDWNYAQVVLRLVVVLEFLWRHVQPLDVAGQRDEYVDGLIAHAEDVITRHFEKAAPRITARTRGRIRWNFRATWFAPAMAKLYAQFDAIDVAAEVGAIPALREADDRLRIDLTADRHPLRSFRPDTNLNDEFRRLYLTLQSSRSRSDRRRSLNGFGAMAALGRSSAIEYFRRSTT